MEDLLCKNRKYTSSVPRVGLDTEEESPSRNLDGHPPANRHIDDEAVVFRCNQ